MYRQRINSSVLVRPDELPIDEQCVEKRRVSDGGYFESVHGDTKFLCQSQPLSSHSILFSIAWHW
jgi:hypothetical protein